jgi:hypothetical protein
MTQERRCDFSLCKLPNCQTFQRFDWTKMIVIKLMGPSACSNFFKNQPSFKLSVSKHLDSTTKAREARPLEPERYPEARSPFRKSSYARSSVSLSSVMTGWISPVSAMEPLSPSAFVTLLTLWISCHDTK